jgi:hypothetical protein
MALTTTWPGWTRSPPELRCQLAQNLITIGARERFRLLGVLCKAVMRWAMARICKAAGDKGFRDREQVLKHTIAPFLV